MWRDFWDAFIYLPPRSVGNHDDLMKEATQGMTMMLTMMTMMILTMMMTMKAWEATQGVTPWCPNPCWRNLIVQLSSPLPPWPTMLSFTVASFTHLLGCCSSIVVLENFYCGHWISHVAGSLVESLKGLQKPAMIWGWRCKGVRFGANNKPAQSLFSSQVARGV